MKDELHHICNGAGKYLRDNGLWSHCFIYFYNGFDWLNLCEYSEENSYRYVRIFVAANNYDYRANTKSMYYSWDYYQLIRSSLY